MALLGLGVYLYFAVHSTAAAVANVRPRAPDEEPTPQEHVAERPAKVPEAKGKGNYMSNRLHSAVREVAAPVDAEAAVERPTIDIKKDELMATANKAYDRGDFDEAMTIAKKVLTEDPQNTRMLRIMVSSSCILGDNNDAHQYYVRLPAGGNDRADMKRRCDKYGVTFSES